MVSEIVLLQGSWYALEQAGRLLRASVVVFNANDPATALALAMFGREELGRSRILQDIAAEIATGRSFSPKDVANRCDDHVQKQRAALLSTTLRVNPPSALAEALQSAFTHGPRSDEWAASRKVINAASVTKTKRDPDDRRRKREDALYVDLHPNGTTWSRPCAITAAAARPEIEDAVNDYAIECDRLRDEVIATDFPKLAMARAGMQPLPVLLPPLWPK
jgi:AbiV family abortive infection protein